MELAVLLSMCAIGGLFIAYHVWSMIRAPRAPALGALDVASPADQLPTAPFVELVDWGGVFVEVDDQRAVVLFVLPQLDPEAVERIRNTRDHGRQIRRVIVINDPTLGGYLWATRVCEVFDIEPDKVHATVANGRIDRVPDGAAPHRTANRLTGDFREGALQLRSVGRNAVLAIHGAFPDRGILVGAAITEEQLIGLPIGELIGSTSGLFAKREALEPMIMRNMRNIDPRGIKLLAGTAPGLDDDMVRLLQTAGFRIEVVPSA